MTVVVATFGGYEWKQLAYDRAIPSAKRQAQVIHCHAPTLHEARNRGLDAVKTDWVCFLDADDELAPGYVDTLLSVGGAADVRVPSVSYIQLSGRPHAPYVPMVAGHEHACQPECLTFGNYIVIGALHRTKLAPRFRPYDFYEDWAYWLEMRQAGATFQTVPEAVYRAYVARDSRNRGPSRLDKERMHQRIYDDLLGGHDDQDPTLE